MKGVLTGKFARVVFLIFFFARAIILPKALKNIKMIFRFKMGSSFSHTFLSSKPRESTSKIHSSFFCSPPWNVSPWKAGASVWHTLGL